MVVVSAASWLALTQRQGLDPSPFLQPPQAAGLGDPVCSRKWSNKTLSDVLRSVVFFPLPSKGGGPQLLPPPSAPAPSPDLPYLRLWTEELLKCTF